MAGYKYKLTTEKLIRPLLQRRGSGRREKSGMRLAIEAMKPGDVLVVDANGADTMRVANRLWSMVREVIKAGLGRRSVRRTADGRVAVVFYKE